MFDNLQFILCHNFKLYFRRYDETKDELGFVFRWILRAGWFEVRAWRDDFLEFLDEAQTMTAEPPAIITPATGDQTGKE